MDILKVKFECTLPETSSCYELDDGTLFLFKFEPPYELSAVVNHRKVEATLPAMVMKEPLTCAGAYSNDLYFYSTPPRRKTYKFYRATVDKNKEIVIFEKINDFRTDDEALHFAHQQPFYVHHSDLRGLFSIGGDYSSRIERITPGTPFFYNRKYVFNLEQDDSIDVVNNSLYFGIKLVTIRVPDPENTAILFQQDTGIVYVITGNQLLVIVECQLVKQFELQCPKNYKRKLNFNSSISISGECDSLMIITAGNNSNNEIDLWSIRLPKRYCEEYASQAPPSSSNNDMFNGMFNGLYNDDKSDKPYKIAGLPILMAQKQAATESPDMQSAPVNQKGKKARSGNSTASAAASAPPVSTTAKKRSLLQNAITGVIVRIIIDTQATATIKAVLLKVVKII